MAYDNSYWTVDRLHVNIYRNYASTVTGIIPVNIDIDNSHNSLDGYQISIEQH